MQCDIQINKHDIYSNKEIKIKVEKINLVKGKIFSEQNITNLEITLCSHNSVQNKYFAVLIICHL